MKNEQKLYLWDWAVVDEPGPRFENLVASQPQRVPDLVALRHHGCHGLESDIAETLGDGRMAFIGKSAGPCDTRFALYGKLGLAIPDDDVARATGRRRRALHR